MPALLACCNAVGMTEASIDTVMMPFTCCEMPCCTAASYAAGLDVVGVTKSTFQPRLSAASRAAQATLKPPWVAARDPGGMIRTVLCFSPLGPVVGWPFRAGVCFAFAAARSRLTFALNATKADDFALA